jgi:hypothetical protein
MDGIAMEKERAGSRWCRLLGVEAVIAVYVSYMLLKYLLRGPVGTALVSGLAMAYFAGALIGGSGPPQRLRRDNPHLPNPLRIGCWLLALVEVLVYSRIRYGL